MRTLPSAGNGARQDTGYSTESSESNVKRIKVVDTQGCRGRTD